MTKAVQASAPSCPLYLKLWVRLAPQASLGLRSSLWSYNPMLTAWEPVIEPWDVIVKLDSNRSNEVHIRLIVACIYC